MVSQVWPSGQAWEPGTGWGELGHQEAGQPGDPRGGGQQVRLDGVQVDTDLGGP